MADDELKKAIERLAAQEKKLASLRWNFWRGAAYGFGFIVGSALLVALFVWALSLFDTAPIIGEYVAKIVDIVKGK
ncbi:MAG: DUF5665 domain-containing protein [Patescibacteria group bacterium]